MNQYSSGFQKCRACGASILFRHTTNGKLMPVDAKPVTILTLKGETVKGHIPHWSTCPEPDKFRKKS